jgi:hypothetical protein
MGDLILPSHFGHREICTCEPSPNPSTSFTSGSSQSAQEALTPMPHTAQRYVAITFPPTSKGKVSVPTRTAVNRFDTAQNSRDFVSGLG